MTTPVRDKLDEALSLFLTRNYSVASPTNLDLLLTHIAGKSNDHDIRGIEYAETYEKWLDNASTLWSSSSDGKPCQALAVFALKLLGVVGRENRRFQRLRSGDIVDRMFGALDLRREDLSASLKMAFTLMVTDFVGHESGRSWIKETGIWRDIVKYALHNHTLYVTRECQRFLSSLLLAESDDYDYCADIIISVTAPIVETTMNTESNVSLADLYSQQCKHLSNSLILTASIIEETLFVNADNRIVDIFEKSANLESRVRALFEACVKTHIFPHVQKLWILLNVRHLKHGISMNSEYLDVDAFAKFRRGMAAGQSLLLTKKCFVELMATHKWSLIYWTRLQTIRKFRLPGEHKFEHQALALMITPLCVCIRSGYTRDHDFFEMFVDKLFDVTCHVVQRSVYSTKVALLGSSDELPLEQICKTMVDYLIELKDIMDRDLAIISFQMMCHVLKNYVSKKCDGTSPSAPEPAPSQDQQIRPVRKSLLDGDPINDVPVLLSTLLNGIAIMAEKFKFKWKECVETTCVLFLAEEILKHPGVRSNICVQALKLCKLAIQDFMPPNLALLVDCDSHMNEMGPTLYKRLHDTNWEIRDSVFETLNTIAVISEDKYPAFQDFLLANHFLQIAVDIAIDDGESYVRASALNFISTTVRINKLWEKKLSDLELPEKAMKLLKEESEGIVRKEAVTLIKDLYVHRQWPKETSDAINVAMAEAAVLDLHWEVKVSALEYWRHFITSHLTDQGVLDGSFPSMTFSKEHRKIVTLDETEIKRRMNKALDELSRQSCLGVLLACLSDDSDYEVARAASVVIIGLKKFLLKYKINEPEAPVPSAKDSAIIDENYVKFRGETKKNEGRDEKDTEIDRDEKSSSVIDDIVDESDTKILASLYKDSTSIDAAVATTRKRTIDSLAKVTREDFLREILSRDIDAAIAEKKRWLDNYTCSFESVLDDVLTSDRTKNVNSIDCY